MIDVLDPEVPVRLTEGPVIFGGLVRKLASAEFAVDLMEAAHRQEAEALFQQILPVPGPELEHVEAIMAADRAVDPYEDAPPWADGAAGWFRDDPDTLTARLEDLPPQTRPVPARILASETGPLPINEIRRLEEEPPDDEARPSRWRRFWRAVDRFVFGDAGFNVKDGRY